PTNALAGCANTTGPAQSIANGTSALPASRSPFREPIRTWDLPKGRPLSVRNGRGLNVEAWYPSKTPHHRGVESAPQTGCDVWDFSRSLYFPFRNHGRCRIQ